MYSKSSDHEKESIMGTHTLLESFPSSLEGGGEDFFGRDEVEHVLSRV